MKLAIEGCIKAASKGKKELPAQQKDAQFNHHIINEILIQYAYPRLDANVTKGVNHLLKSPFCIHPKTGRICVPFAASEVDDFDPFQVPTIEQIISEIDVNGKSNEPDENGTDQLSGKRKVPIPPSLKHCMDVFENFIKGMEQEQRRNLIERNEAKMEF